MEPTKKLLPPPTRHNHKPKPVKKTEKKQLEKATQQIARTNSLKNQNNLCAYHQQIQGTNILEELGRSRLQNKLNASTYLNSLREEFPQETQRLKILN